MGANLFLNALFWFLQLLEYLALISDFVGFVATLKKEKNEPYVVLTVKRPARKRGRADPGRRMAKPTYKNGGRVPKIIVVDLGSTDNTPDILKNLQVTTTLYKLPTRKAISNLYGKWHNNIFSIKKAA